LITLPHAFLATWRLTGPAWHEAALEAKRSDESVSCRWRSCGETLTNISIFELPESAFCSRWDNLELRYGTWRALVDMAVITSPSADKLLLMHARILDTLRAR